MSLSPAVQIVSAVVARNVASGGTRRPYFAFARAMFDDLSKLHGDKGVWKLMDRAGDSVVDVRVPGSIPLDVDTWADYEAVLSDEAAQRQVGDLGSGGDLTGPHRDPGESVGCGRGSDLMRLLTPEWLE